MAGSSSNSILACWGRYYLKLSHDTQLSMHVSVVPCDADSEVCVCSQLHGEIVFFAME